jgi:hypothetical protein
MYPLYVASRSMMRTAPLSKASGGGSRSSMTLAPAPWALAEGNALEWKHSPSTRQRGGERMRGRAFVEGRRRSDLLDVGLRCRLRNQRDLKEWLILRAARVRQSALRSRGTEIGSSNRVSRASNAPHWDAEVQLTGIRRPDSRSLEIPCSRPARRARQFSICTP